VARLKQELGDLHGTDTVALKYIMGLEQCARFLANDSFDTRVHAFRRAYKSLAQHITALQAESIVSVVLQHCCLMAARTTSTL